MFLLFLYLVIINIVAFAAYGIDKRRAVRHLFRISESTLLCLAAVGGSAGAFIGMRVFHHKTRKPKFKYGVPLILLLHAALLALVFPAAF